MHKKVHKYSGITRGLMLSLFFSVATIQSCQKKAPDKKIEKIENKEKVTQYNLTLAKTLRKAWEDGFVATDNLEKATEQELQQMIATINELRELIEEGELENLDPALENFFGTHGTKEKLQPGVAFKNLLPKIPAQKPDSHKILAKELIQAKTKLFTLCFAKCKNHFLQEKA